MLPSANIIGTVALTLAIVGAAWFVISLILVIWFIYTLNNMNKSLSAMQKKLTAVNAAVSDIRICAINNANAKIEPTQNQI